MSSWWQVRRWSQERVSYNPNMDGVFPLEDMGFYHDCYCYRYKYYYYDDYYWLVVSSPLKNMKVSWEYYSQYVEK